MSIKIKSSLLSKRNLLHILTILLTSGTMFVFLPFMRNMYGVDADLISHHLSDEQTETNFDGQLSVFHKNTIIPRSEIKVEKREVVVSAVKVESSPEVLAVVDIINTTITGYSSTVDQTNSEPFITASGSWVRDGIVAANFLPFGTRIRIPELFGNKVFVVKDRMNQRYNNRVDIWFSTRQQAINLGVRNTYIEIVR